MSEEEGKKIYRSLHDLCTKDPKRCILDLSFYECDNKFRSEPDRTANPEGKKCSTGVLKEASDLEDKKK